MNDNIEFIERLVTVRRVAKTTKGGRNMSFAALMVVGDGKGQVGVGYGKAREVPAAVAKATQEAKSKFFEAPMVQGTISHPVQGEDAAGVVFMRPASPGTGVIAGGPVRAVLEAAGYTDVLTKSLGSSNPLNIVNATIAALKQLEKPEAVAIRRGLSLEHVVPARLLQNIAKDQVTNESATDEVTSNSEAKADEVLVVSDIEDVKEDAKADTKKATKQASADKSDDK